LSLNTDALTDVYFGPRFLRARLRGEASSLESGKDGKLEIPDPETTFPLNEMLKATRILVKETQGRVFIMGRADQGPMALAAALWGPENLLEATAN
jgi:hypothetical protein